MTEAFICDAVRTPIGRYAGALSGIRTDDLAALPIAALMKRHAAADWQAVDDVVLGCANQAGEDNRNLARMAALLAGLPAEVPGVTVNRLCGSGLDAVAIAARQVRSGEAGLVIAGGAESMSRAPYALSKPDAAFTRVGSGWRLSPTPAPTLRALTELPLVVVDVETTGGRPPGDRITEIGAVSLVGGRIVEEWSALVDPGRSIPGFVKRLTGIDDRLLAGAPPFDGVADEFLSFLGGTTFVAHNAHFDWRFVNAELLRARSGTLANPRLCTVRLARALLPHVRRRSLDALAWLFGITRNVVLNRQRAHLGEDRRAEAGDAAGESIGHWIVPY